MNTLTENQKLRLTLLTMCGFDTEKATKALNFVTTSEPVTDSPKPEKTNELADGIYIVCEKAEIVRYTGPQTETINDSVGIGIKLGSKSLVVAKDEAAITADLCSTLTTKAGGKRFFKTFEDAVADWDGKAGTDDLREILNPDLKLEGGQYIPSLGQMYFILCHLKEINEAMEFIGGRKLEDTWYWTSTSYNAIYAWCLTLGNGGAGTGTKATYQSRVRPVSAFI